MDVGGGKKDLFSHVYDCRTAVLLNQTVVSYRTDFVRNRLNRCFDFFVGLFYYEHFFAEKMAFKKVFKKKDIVKIGTVQHSHCSTFS